MKKKIKDTIRKKKIRRLAIIPAREGSKRVKNKNLKKFHGQPLIYYSIKAAKNSKLFDKIHISSDSKKILDYSKKLGIKDDFIRPKILSGDKIGLEPVIEYVSDQYLRKGEFFDQVWLIYATNPFINKKIIKSCEIQFRKKFSVRNHALMTVTKYNYPAQWAMKINKLGYLKAFNKKNLKLRSQNLIETYCDAGMINIYPGNKSLRKLSNIKYFPFEISIYNSFDIDTKEDFSIAKKIFKLKK